MGTIMGSEDEVRIGSRIRSAREAAGIGRADLSGRLGHTRQWLAAIELGRARVAASDLERLAQEIGIAPGYLLGAPVDLELDAQGVRLAFGLWQQLTDRDKQELIEFARLRARLNEDLKRVRNLEGESNG